ncbi:MAG: phosphate ABC transporter substrate-binding protein PstS [Microcoleus sp. PH2017_10_PVI_O_A]|uniref:phosphate ABC transporter substrate-binding protein PstS n=1 Tax=unclassified Microcoleus TaxID=2642155 RepID=UPI001DD1F71A|nr:MULTISPECIES: phosphate ABC transporter substrate-binding protein PstS [unclassified Microcoleus]TAF31818.1 MAG: phosphate ABC transporter substrate-binding protein PstS [Oscillatoriales cyanobacterium]MCC3408960.1 phosphate ABC transporter substrate-binding protein PstS [Microcoleus sp. PH2017_10_PVI_O_A]MCC3463095.1 phosphate ABC transporter substrate-binding protein PstS [Microcoleus sp. PH2017_11_PCY_U_A]MCC3481482.1 phosphate ABC transporter substrate-binding protein PstS [Microcoleus s
MLFRLNLINPNRVTTAISAMAIALSLAACGGGGTTTGSSPSPGDTAASPGTSPAASPVAAAANTKLALASDVAITAAGASFPAPLYQRWFQDFNKINPKVQINYQSVGSGAGVEQFTKGTVDFGASDTGMKDDEIAKVPADKGVILLPMTAGSIVIGYNLPDVPELKLPRDVYTEIFQGKITKWNDPKIAAANPGAKLPDQNITVVHRSDGSGTTAVFTKHLSAISPDWKTAVGDGKTVEWPKTGTFIGAKGNEGVTAQILQTAGSFGYIEYGYAKNNNVKFASLQNKAGTFVVPTDDSASAALATVPLPEDLRAFIEDPEGAQSYPIVTYTWMLVPKKVADPNKAKTIEAMVEYGLNEGQKVSSELGYVPLPQSVKEKVAAAADGISPEYKIEIGK